MKDLVDGDGEGWGGQDFILNVMENLCKVLGRGMNDMSIFLNIVDQSNK